MKHTTKPLLHPAIGTQVRKLRRAGLDHSLTNILKGVVPSFGLQDGTTKWAKRNGRIC